MRFLGRVRQRWTARRNALAMGQLEGDQVRQVGQHPATDAVTDLHQQSARALGGLLNPKATTKTEWRGD